MANGPLGYSENDLARDLRAWWDEQVGNGDDPFADPVPSRGPDTIFEVIPELDSLAMVEGLITAEKHVGFEIPPCVIRRGGYSSFDDMVGDLLPKLRDEASKRNRSEKAA